MPPLPHASPLRFTVIMPRPGRAKKEAGACLSPQGQSTKQYGEVAMVEGKIENTQHSLEALSGYATL